MQLFDTDSISYVNATPREKKFEKESVLYYLKQRKIIVNLLIMSVIWLTTVFNFYLNMFILNTFKQIYLCAVLGALSDIFAYIFSGAVYRTLGIRWTLSMLFMSSFAGGLLILVYGLKHKSMWVFPFLVMFQRIGITGSYNVISIGNSDIFPVLFATTAFGLCNFLGRASAVVSPIMALMKEPLPMQIFTATSFITIFIVWGLQLGKDETKESKEQGKSEGLKKSA